MNGFSWSTGISQGGLGFPGLSSLSVVVAWIFDPIIATGGLGVDPLMMTPPTVGTVFLLSLATALILTWFAVVVRPRSKSPTMRLTA